jgi:hypothetical protein
VRFEFCVLSCEFFFSPSQAFFSPSLVLLDRCRETVNTVDDSRNRNSRRRRSVESDKRWDRAVGVGGFSKYIAIKQGRLSGRKMTRAGRLAGA